MLLKTIAETRDLVREIKSRGNTIGLVPTMGYLHEGHCSLIKKAAEENDIVIVSVFVNPIQFGPNEDFESYPRDIDADYKKAIAAGADYIFNPEPAEMYPEPLLSFVEVEKITDNLCGADRPGHFRGVTTVCTKLFHITRADKGYFGEKDAQQLAVIRRMVKDLNYNIEIVPCPIIRESDGLAMSSRNTYLSPEERKDALLLSRSIFAAEKTVQTGEKSAGKLLQEMKKTILSSPLAEIDYVKAVDADTLEDITELSGKVLIALAVKIGKTRLIDNISLEVK